MSASATRSEPQTDPQTDPLRPPWRGLTVVLGGLFMIAMDAAIVNVAAPRIRDDLDASASALVLVVSGYTLAYAMLLITSARLGDDHGHRRLFLTGLAGFTLTSLMCGLSPNVTVLIATRVAQGATGALMGPQVLSIIQTQFTGEAQRRAVPLYATVLAVGTVVGQIAGGVLVTADLLGSGWRPVFLINVPTGAALMLAARRCLAPSRGVAPRRADPGGVALVSTSVLLLMLPMIVGQEQGWPLWTYCSLAAGAAFVVASGVHMRSQTRRGNDPLVDPSFFRSAGARQGLSSLLAMQVAYGGFLFAFALHLQSGLGASPLRSGLTFTPFAAAFTVTSLGYRKLPPPAQRWASPVGFGVLAVGYAAVGLLARHGSWGQELIAMLFVAGAGFGASFSMMVAKTVAHTPTRLAPEASGLVSSVVQLGFVAGVATLGTWYLTLTGDTGSSSKAFAGVSIAAAALVAAGALTSGRRQFRRRHVPRPSPPPTPLPSTSLYAPVTRRVQRAPSSVQRALTGDRNVFGFTISLAPHGALRLTQPFAAAVMPPQPTWRARARLYGRGVRLARYTRVELEITVWSERACELRIWPVARHFGTWGVRRLRRYFALAHQAADRLVRTLTTIAPEHPVAVAAHQPSLPNERLVRRR